MSAVAIVGYAGRFPGAGGVAALWRNLLAGVESIRRLTPREVLAAGVDPRDAAHPDFVPVESFPDGVEDFDAPFFGMSHGEAQITDPQHRLLLECAWEALADAGYDPFRYPGSTGVFAGATLNTYLILHLLADPAALATLQPVQINIGNGGDFLTTRVSYKLNLRGPSHTVQSACSTSLVAVHLACQQLLDEECDMALAGGVAINLSLRGGYRHAEGGMASPDGHCRPFAADAAGTVFGNGCGVVVLKRLADALAAGDSIRAVIRGSAVNNDGSFKLGYTAPSVDGQAAVISEALANSGVPAATIGYVEAHGTATPLGDPVEVAALTRAFRTGTGKRGFCALGSVKGNLGHLDSAAGVTGLLRAVLALENGIVPPTLHAERLHPEIDFAASPFFVSPRPFAWEAGGGAPRRAAVSAFGVGGTNAHVVLEEAPAVAPGAVPGRPCQLLTLSAHTPSALATATTDLRRHFETTPELPPDRLADAAFTLQVGRRELPHRRAVVCRDRETAIAALGQPELCLDGTAGHRAPTIAFLFPGQGSQTPGMTAGLYRDEPVFRDEVDRCCQRLAPWLGFDLRQVLYPVAGDAAAAASLEQTAVAQPALLVVELALARLWAAWGVRPKVLAGHSLGEITAACLAGAIAVEEALALVVARGRLMEEVAAGAMLSVALGEEEVAPWLAAAPGLALAAVNTPGRSVLSGPVDAVAELERRLAAEGLSGRRLAVDRAFHSAMMEPVLAPFAALVGGLDLRPPAIPYLSNLTGTWIRPEQATAPDAWAEQLRRPVRFADNLAELLRDPELVLLEVGPGRTLSQAARQHPACGPERLVLPSLPQRGGADAESMLQALGRLWARGLAVDWAGLHGGERRRRVPLPGNPFERQRCWVEARRNPFSAPAAPAPSPAPRPAAETTPPEPPASALDRRPRPDLAVAYVAPAGDLERRIAAVWQQVLGIARVGALDNFFDLGGDSLIAIQAIDLLKGELRREIPATSLYEGTTIRSLAGLLAMAAGAEEAAAPSGGARHDRRQQWRQQARSRRREPAAGLAGAAPAAWNEQEE